MFQLKYLSSKARHEKSVKGVVSFSITFLNEQRFFVAIILSNRALFSIILLYNVSATSASLFVNIRYSIMICTIKC